MKIKKSFSVAVLMSLVVATQSVSAAPNPPVPVDSTPFTIAANSAFYACTFDLQVEYMGKGKTINLPGGRFVMTTISPALNVKLTNLSSPSKTVTLNITGASHKELDDYGNQVYTMTGRNLVGDPTTGLVLTMGNFSYAFDSSGTTLVKSLSGTGRMLPVCPMLE